MCEVKYKPVMHDGPHTMEQQVLLLTGAAARAWRVWMGGNGKDGLQGFNTELDEAMREIYRQCYQTDVFMGGVHHGQSR